MQTLSHDEIYELINYLQGTCLSLNEGLKHVHDIDQGDIKNDMEMYGIIDDSIFLCSHCGWWCEAGDWIDDSHPNYNPCEEICSQCGEY